MVSDASSTRKQQIFQHNFQMLQKAPKKCGSLSRKLKGKLSTIYNMPQEQRGEEEMQITAQVSLPKSFLLFSF